MPTHLNIYHFNDYREYLRDYFALQKQTDPSFTLRSFAKKAGFGAHSFCGYLISGKRNLSPDGARKLGVALGFNKKESDFFELLVAFNQSWAVEQRDELFRRLNLLRRNSTFYKLNKQHYAYFDEWYYPAMRELVVHGDWRGDYARLGAMLDPPITAGAARRTVNALAAMRLIRCDAKGAWSQTSEVVIAEKLPQHLVKKARAEYFKLAIAASENIGPESRTLSCATVALSKEAYDKVARMLDTLHEQVVALASQGGIPDKIYQMNLQLFPLSASLRNTSGGCDE
jgi:uncharacterized protein (TIGR02147 family)